jgi:hypothetical protein
MVLYLCETCTKFSYARIEARERFVGWGSGEGAVCGWARECCVGWGEDRGAVRGLWGSLRGKKIIE